jgi:hypothetical protein
MCAEAIKHERRPIMAFYLDFDYSKGEWFEYPEQPELRLKMRYLAPTLLSTLREENKDTKGKLISDDFAIAVLSYVLIAWEGFYEGEAEKAKPADLKRENIKKLFDIDPAIVGWVFSIVTKRRNFDVKNEDDKAVKNSKSSSASR